MTVEVIRNSRKIRIEDLEAFLAVAEAGSFRRAADLLGVGQPAISRRLQGLEDRLGVSLLERHSSGARLTVAGWSFASRARSILDDLKTAAETAGSAGIAESGEFRVGLIASLSAGPLRSVFERFFAAHGGIEVCFIESGRNELLTHLSHRLLDAVVAVGEPRPEHGDSILLVHEKIFIAIPSDHEWVNRERLDWADVRDATFLVGSREPEAETHDYILRRLSEMGRIATVRRHRLGREGVMNLVGLGLGVSLVADHSLGVNYPNVSFIPVGAMGERLPLSVIWKPENDNPALRRFISLARIEAKRNGVLS